MAYTYGKPGTKALRALMRSKKSLARLAVEDRGGLCFFGANTEHPCEREAVATHPEPGETEIVLCAEHARAYRLRDDADTLHDALEMLHRWIQDGAPGEDSYAADIVRDGLYHQREALERRYFDTLIKRRGADLMADGAPTGPDKAWEYPPSLEAAEALARSNLISDALGNALAVVEDAPAEAFGNITDRHEVAAALQAAHEDASRASRGDRERAGLSSRSE